MDLLSEPLNSHKLLAIGSGGRLLGPLNLDAWRSRFCLRKVPGLPVHVRMQLGFGGTVNLKL